METDSAATVFRLDSLDGEIHELRKELGVLTTDACEPEISLYWQGNGAELEEISVQLRNDLRQRREVDQWRMNDEVTPRRRSGNGRWRLIYIRTWERQPCSNVWTTDVDR